DLNEACSEGELADSFRRSAEALSEFISRMAQFAADEAFPTLIKWLEWVIDHSDAIISAVKGMGAAWASWKIMQYANHLKELVSAIQLVNSAAAASNAAQEALAVSGASAAASEEAMAVAANKLAAAQQLAVAAFAALAIAIGTFIAKQIDAAAENLRNKNQLDETTQALYDQAEAYKVAAETARENSKSADKAAETTRKYWQDVKSLVDEQGKATCSAEDLQNAVAQLNTVAGTNIEVVNGQIVGYQQLIDTMDDYIESTRKQAKLSYMQDSYGEALTNIKDVTEQYQEVYNKRISAAEDYEKKRIRYLNSDKSNTKEERQRYKDEMDAAAEYLAQVATQESSLKSRMDSYNNTIQEYESIRNTPLPSQIISDPIKFAAEEEAKQIEEINRKNAELAAMGVKQTWDELQASLEELDGQLAIKAVSEQDYWEQRRQLLEDSQYKESAEWWEYYDKVEEYYDKLADTEQKARDAETKNREAAQKEGQATLKKNIDNQIAALKEKQQLDESYTKERMYNDMEIVISSLDKESDLYKKYSSEILKGRKDLADEIKKTATEENKKTVTEIEKQLQEEVNTYKNKLKELQKERDDYFNKWFDTSKFTSTSKQKDKNGNEADVFSLADPKDALKELEEYEKAEEKLRAKGVSENLMDWIDTLDKATAKDTIDTLNHMSDKNLKEYSDNFDKYKAKVEQKTEDKYGPQIEELNQGFIQKVDGLMAQLPDRASAEGANTVAGFVAGLGSKSEDLSEAVKSFTDEIINGIKDNLDIHSPSKETEELGEHTASGFINGLTAESMTGAVDKFTGAFLEKLAQKDPVIREAMESAFTDNLEAVLGDMESLADKSLNGIALSLAGKMPALPDVTKLSLPDFDTVSGAAGGTALAEISAKLDKLDKLENLDVIISLIQSVTVTSSGGGTIKLQLELNGRLEADMDRLAAVIAQKFDNIAIRTGRQVFHY
ncbi:MAG: hypothetical protein NC078_01655, partial [Ruminococcus sp.]|nr:hypothetical protein [Ruminococcus sp.]